MAKMSHYLFDEVNYIGKMHLSEPEIMKVEILFIDQG